MRIPFNRPHMTGNELHYIAEAHANQMLAGSGPFTEKCQHWLRDNIGCESALLTHSCTAALEMCGLLLGLNPGDEVIMPAFTFVSTANAFALRGAVPVFVDIRPDTLNLDESLLEAAITGRTRAIVVVHYAGVACEMDAINLIAHARGIPVIEDAAHGVMASYRGKPLGACADLGTFSFHETKNVISGEGGALLLNRPGDVGLAEMIWEKGTDRGRFFRGEVEKYSWQCLGSSFLPGEIIAAFLWAQLEQAHTITNQRLQLWRRYHENLASLEAEERLRRPMAPPECRHNAHMYYILLPDEEKKEGLRTQLGEAGVTAVSHYVPLHTAPAAAALGVKAVVLPVTESVAGRLLRLPLWYDMTLEMVDEVCDRIEQLSGS